MVESEKCISPIEWDRNSEENSMEENEHEIRPTTEVKEIQRICTQSSPNVDANYRLPTRIKYLFHEARYFMIKSNNFENVSLAKVRNVWSTIRANEIRLNKAFYETKNGYARLASPSNPKKHINWVLPSHMSQKQLSGIFQIDWLSREEVPFSKTNHLVNAWNEHKPVKIGRDGQEIEPSCGEFLCRLFVLDEDCKFNEIIEKAKAGPPEYRDRDSNRNYQSDSRNQDNYNNKPVSYGDSSYDDYRTQYNSSRSHSDRKKEAYTDSSRSKDRNRYENTNDVFLNGNYEDYLREQTSYNRVYNQYSARKMTKDAFENIKQQYVRHAEVGQHYVSLHAGKADCDRYEQRVDDFLRNIVSRDRPIRNHDTSSDYSHSSSSSYKKRRQRSRSRDRRSGHSYKYRSRRYRSGSRHRH